MITRVSSAVTWGIQAFPIDVEVDMALGISQLTIVGLPDQAVRESKDRVRSAIQNSGYEFPMKKVTVNLAPADLKKEGPLFDLPIALAILAAEGFVDPAILKKYLAVGELGLDGKLRPVSSIIQAALLAQSIDKTFLFPGANLPEIALIDQGQDKTVTPFIPLSSLKDAIAYLKEGHFSLTPIDSLEIPAALPREALDFKDVKGQRQAKRALEIAVSGGHNLLMMGPPGGGKTMLARRLPSILPPLGKKEALEIAMIYGVGDECGKKDRNYFAPPFRAPHHSLSTPSLVGGGPLPKPGEVSLAHRGILFLDELSEFKKDALESLRAPLEDKRILISRVNGSVDFPASFMLVAASNPCACGYLTSRLRSCRCSLAQMENYRRRLSGPLIDRIDLHVEMPELDWDDLRSQRQEETSETIRMRVERTRAIQKKRYSEFSFSTNSEMGEEAMKAFCILDKNSESLLKSAMKEMGLSARAHSRILKIGRTLADMEESSSIQEHHIQEAVKYRLLDRQFIHV